MSKTFKHHHVALQLMRESLGVVVMALMMVASRLLLGGPAKISGISPELAGETLNIGGQSPQVLEYSFRR
jgi:hypothetical protein